MSALLAGLPVDVPGTTVNRLCGSGMDATGIAARAIRAGEAELMLAGGVESMSPRTLRHGQGRDRRSPATPGSSTPRSAGGSSTRRCRRSFGTDSMPQTADNVAADYRIGREDQDAFALRSQQRWAAADAAGFFAAEIVPVEVPQKGREPGCSTRDEHPRPDTTLDKLARLKGVNGPELSVTAGNASGVNDGACALLLASEAAARRYGLTPRARVVGHGDGRRAAADHGHRARCRRRARCWRGRAARSTRWT